ncbi:MAG: M55 family metallopeptidase, partial [Phycisphaerae bacterium]|nr:M55 family metallopeptidase [Phycisphaerae bacterium]
DQALCEEAQALIPNIVTAAVKKGLSRLTAVHLPPEKSRQMIREGIARALEQCSRIEPVKLTGPFRLEREYVATDMADSFAAKPPAVRIDSRTVLNENEDYFELLREVFLD